MARFLVRRCLFALILVVGVSSCALLLTRLAPGDLTAELGPLAPPDQVQALRARFDLDRGVIGQWALWAGRAVRFDFGQSYLYNRPVSDVVARAAANTALLASAALITAVAAGIGGGVVTGWPGAHRLAPLVRAVSLLGVSIPPLITSLLFIFLAARTGWFPVGGMVSAAAGQWPWGPWLMDFAWHLVLPTLALALPIAATFEQLQAQALGAEVGRPYLVAAVARGVPEHAVRWRHAWPSSWRSLCAVFGIAFGSLLSGSFVVEHVTAWPGLGRLMYDALRARDIYLVAGCAACGAFFLAVGSLVGDVLLAVSDPRVAENRS